MNDAKSILEINEYELDVEWKNQPLAYYEFATKLADAKAKHDQAKSDLEVTKAKICLEIRQNPDAYQLDKITESTVSHALLTESEHMTATNTVILARHKVDMLQAVVTALDHKKRALESLVSLHGQKYFSEPITDHESNNVLEDMEKRKARKMRSRRSQDN